MEILITASLHSMKMCMCFCLSAPLLAQHDKSTVRKGCMQHHTLSSRIQQEHLRPNCWNWNIMHEFVHLHLNLYLSSTQAEEISPKTRPIFCAINFNFNSLLAELDQWIVSRATWRALPFAIDAAFAYYYLALKLIINFAYWIPCTLNGFTRE